MKLGISRYMPVAAKFQHRIENTDLALRLLRWRDLALLYSIFASEVFLKESGAGFKPFSSLLTFWRWLVSVFHRFYVILMYREGRSTVIGFIGFYNVRVHKSLMLSIAIFAPEYRRKGYGRRSVGMLLDYLLKNNIVGRVAAEVPEADPRSLSFFHAMGFNVCGRDEDKLLLEKFLKEKVG